MYSPAFFAAFDLFFSPWRGRRLRTVLVPPLPLLPPGPLLLVANHTSWWDGFLLRDLQRALRPGAPFHVVMREAELRRRPFFRLMGALPLQPGSPASTRALLRTVGKLVQDEPGAVIVFFPQGRIWPSSRRPLGFRRGVDLLTAAAAPCTVLPVALHVEPLNRSAPVAFIAPAVAVTVGSGDAARNIHQRVEAAVAARLDALRAVLDAHGEDAMQHLEPSR
jgi:1-acyl-sn-glycerol-3-phosphate acyltransferase